jgi:hypothetical protein
MSQPAPPIRNDGLDLYERIHSINRFRISMHATKSSPRQVSSANPFHAEYPHAFFFGFLGFSGAST